MGKFHNTEGRNRANVEQPDFRVSVTDFGPIKSGYVDLRPLTIFVGPSNTGKTYFAILIYAFRRILGGFPRLPVMFSHQHRFFGQGGGLDLSTTTADALVEELKRTLGELDTEGRLFKFSGLPKSVRDLAQAVLSDPDSLGAILGTELQRCFDLESVSDLVRLTRRANMNISLAASEKARSLWHYQLEVSGAKISTHGHIEDMGLFPNGLPIEVSEFRQGLSDFRELIKERQGHDSVWDSQFLLDLFEELICLTAVNRHSETHYLPAARSGIMQSHRVFASSLVARSTRGGLDLFPELPTISGVMADFMQRLILYEESRGRDESIRDLADALESGTLAGKIATRMPQGGGYPEFVYRPEKSKRDIRLTRASSMVSELAPVVLFLRGTVSPGDMLIIEEPEAHLHPGAQTQMAKTLARLVRAGVKVVVTTHSDWLLMEIANLMREGELEELKENQESDTSRSTSLLPNEVGVWLFRENGDASGSTIEEIPFDRSEGIEPQEYENVAEALYNRSATLQNRFQELAGAAEREQE